jgi:hypothetical protein
VRARAGQLAGLASLQDPGGTAGRVLGSKMAVGKGEGRACSLSRQDWLRLAAQHPLRRSYGCLLTVYTQPGEPCH